MQRYKAVVEYCGTNFVGWQRQKNGISIQQVLEDTISKFTNQQVKITASGRTDAGVHALGQVVHFDLTDNFHLDSSTLNVDQNSSRQNMLPNVCNPHKLLSSLNHFLRPHPIRILDCELVNTKFHSRFSAKSRHYKYRILNRMVEPVIDKDRVLWVKQTLDVNKIIDSAQCLVGTHDFTSFRAASCQAPSPIKTLSEINIINNYPEIEIQISASAFLHHMVRNIVGTLVNIGLNKMMVSDMARILAAKNRNTAGPTAPATGLYLTKVDY